MVVSLWVDHYFWCRVSARYALTDSHCWGDPDVLCGAWIPLFEYVSIHRPLLPSLADSRRDLVRNSRGARRPPAKLLRAYGGILVGRPLFWCDVRCCAWILLFEYVSLHRPLLHSLAREGTWPQFEGVLIVEMIRRASREIEAASTQCMPSPRVVSVHNIGL